MYLLRTMVLFAAFVTTLCSSFLAKAGVIAKTHTQDPATSCTLSVPTTDTKVRPKALGFRNEGTTNAFVICGIDNHSNQAGFHWIQIEFESFDGKGDTFDCTAVSRTASSSFAQYLPKTIVVTPAVGGYLSIADDDFDYDPQIYDLKHQGQSVTCLLPPGIEVTAVAGGQDDVDSAP